MPMYHNDNACWENSTYRQTIKISNVGEHHFKQMKYRNNDYNFEQFDVFWFRKNLLGDITEVYSASGQKLVSYTYDAPGNRTTEFYNGTTYYSPAAQNPFTCRGYFKLQTLP